MKFWNPDLKIWVDASVTKVERDSSHGFVTNYDLDVALCIHPVRVKCCNIPANVSVSDEALGEFNNVSCMGPEGVVCHSVELTSSNVK